MRSTFLGMAAAPSPAATRRLHSTVWNSGSSKRHRGWTHVFSKYPCLHSFAKSCQSWSVNDRVFPRRLSSLNTEERQSTTVPKTSNRRTSIPSMRPDSRKHAVDVMGGNIEFSDLEVQWCQSSHDHLLQYATATLCFRELDGLGHITALNKLTGS